MHIWKICNAERIAGYNNILSILRQIASRVKRLSIIYAQFNLQLARIYFILSR